MSELPLSQTQFLERVKCVSLPSVEAFVPRRCFVGGNPDGVRLGWLSEDFRHYFLGEVGNCEISLPARALRIDQLTEWTNDQRIIEELGGEQVVEIHLPDLWELMKRQPQARRGDLLTNGAATFGYIRDFRDARLWAVSCFRTSSAEGWSLQIRSPKDPHLRYAPRQVLTYESPLPIM